MANKAKSNLKDFSCSFSGSAIMDSNASRGLAAFFSITQGVNVGFNPARLMAASTSDGRMPL
jgi:hypothetical protein